MKPHSILPYLYSNLASVFSSLLVLILAEAEVWQIAVMMPLSVLLITPVHTIFLFALFMPYSKEYSPATSYFITLLPLLIVSLLALPNIQQPDFYSLTMLAMQFCAAALSYCFYFGQPVPATSEKEISTSSNHSENLSYEKI